MARSGTQGFTEVEITAWSGFLAVQSLVTRELDALVGAEQGMVGGVRGPAQTRYQRRPEAHV